MNSNQILAIIYLLLAFGVPQPTVDTVQGILQRAAPVSARSVPLSAPVSSPVQTGIGEVGAPTIDCTPTLSAQVIKVAGNITTGIDFMFIGTSTVPVGCVVDMTLENTLRMPMGKYHGPLGDWFKNGHIKYIDNGFVFSQGWGTGEGVTPGGSFVWTVGSTSTTTSI